MVEFRVLESLKFILKNAVLKLGSKCKYYIVCGHKNYDFIREINKSMGNIYCIHNLEVDNLNHNQYNNLLYTTKFWNIFTEQNTVMKVMTVLILDKQHSV